MEFACGDHSESEREGEIVKIADFEKSRCTIFVVHLKIIRCLQTPKSSEAVTPTESALESRHSRKSKLYLHRAKPRLAFGKTGGNLDPTRSGIEFNSQINRVRLFELSRRRNS